MKSEQNEQAVLGPVERQVRPGAEARPLVERLRSGVYGTNRIPLCDEAADEIERLRHERDTLGAAIGDAAVKAGIVVAGTPLTGPHLVMLCDDLAMGLGPNVGAKLETTAPAQD